MTPASPLTTIIVTHNNARTIGACLDSLRRQDLHPIHVVDNASRDGTVQHLAPESIVQITRHPTNQGFAAAANHAASNAITDYLLFFNPDAQLQSSPQPALDYLRAHPRVAAISLGLRSPAGQLEPHSFGFRPVTPTSLFTRKLPASAPRPTSVQPVAWVSAGALLVRRSAFWEVGGFDPQFFLYWEDVDLSRRLRLAGYQLLLFPQLSVRHQRGHSLSDSHRKARLYDQSADSYFRKHYPAYIWWPLRIIRRLYRLLWPRSR